MPDLHCPFGAYLGAAEAPYAAVIIKIQSPFSPFLITCVGQASMQKLQRVQMFLSSFGFEEFHALPYRIIYL